MATDATAPTHHLLKVTVQLDELGRTPAATLLATLFATTTGHLGAPSGAALWRGADGGEHTFSGEVPAAPDDVRRLARYLVEAGIPERAPRLRDAPDSSDRFAALRLVLTLDAHPTRLVELSLMSSGYDGPDAAPVRAFLAEVLRLLAIDDPRIVCDLAGHAGART